MQLPSLSTFDHPIDHIASYLQACALTFLLNCSPTAWTERYRDHKIIPYFSIALLAAGSHNGETVALEHFKLS